MISWLLTWGEHLSANYENVRRLFPELFDVTDSVGKAVVDSASVMDIPPGTVLFRQGDLCHNYLLVLEGTVRVYARAENGREIVLYRIGTGGSCVLTTTCLMGKRSYPAEGVTESAVKALAISAAAFQRGIAQSERLREFVFQSYGERLSELIVLLEEVAFQRIDIRLARHLLERTRHQPVLAATHQALAVELGSAREVVSRQLKEFEKKRWLSLQRGSINILDRAAIEAFAAVLL